MCTLQSWNYCNDVFYSFSIFVVYITLNDENNFKIKKGSIPTIYSLINDI